jgi:hypothetical protein
LQLYFDRYIEDLRSAHDPFEEQQVIRSLISTLCRGPLGPGEIYFHKDDKIMQELTQKYQLALKQALDLAISLLR